MTDLPRELRRTLESTVKAARVSAELGAADALRRLGVFDCRRPGHLTDARNDVRKRLRAHAKSVGERLDGADGEILRRLTEAAAYVQWHRLLFARFLVERGLLRDETGIAISLADCREEAAMAGAGDEWSIAAAHAARMLPGVFPPDDPVEALVLAPEHAKALRDHLRELESAIFQADDSLGWTYQFWRAAEKKAVNDSQVKIGAAELPAVTQLFTEPYMVRFLLHNTLGAWWAGKMLATRPDLARDAADETALRSACALPGYVWEFLRFVREDDSWRPAAGVFPGWPTNAAALTVLDPCCGSGHFLTEALAALAALRRAEEGLMPADAVVAVLRDNLAGLEIDGRCVQIAAFALALTGWRIGGAGASLPTPHVAWVGAPPPLPKVEFAALANGDAELRRGLEALHDLFARAPLLGSLIEPVGGDLMDPTRVARIEDSIVALVKKMRGAEPERAEGALAARGMADAAAILSRRWVLQVTNVPFLGRGRQDAALAAHLAARFDVAKADLATSMLERMRLLAAPSGTVAAVTPQYWLFLSGYKNFRRRILTETTIDAVAKLGSGAFETISGEVVKVCLFIASEMRPAGNSFLSLDIADLQSSVSKQSGLVELGAAIMGQQSQMGNPDIVIGYDGTHSRELLEKHAYCFQGLATSDNSQFILNWWELRSRERGWELFQMAPDGTSVIGGCSWIIHWDDGRGRYFRHAQSLKEEGRLGGWRSGEGAWGKIGVAINRMGDLKCSLYVGAMFDCNVAVMIPNDPDKLEWILARVSDDQYADDVRKINQKTSVTNLTLLKVPVGDTKKLVSPELLDDRLITADPTQWLFHGHPRHAALGTELHVALARLSGYRWPAEIDVSMRLSAEARALIAETATLPAPDADGLLALVPVLGERPLADRLRAFCAAAWGEVWAPGTEATLVATACERANDKPPKQLTIDAWLRTHAARQHAKLFHERPFLWWITDGRADGFTAIAHYHRLTRANLERLTWTVLGDWIARLGDDPRAEAARVLQAKLARILEGEKPYDIFVRWKPLHAQPLGWDPDLDDGVRQNIRPFIKAGVLGCTLEQILKDVDRGKDAASAPWFATFNGERRNDHHTTLEEKRAARLRAAPS